MVFGNKKYGFTLAELMITLSMIGVLATLTVTTIGFSVQQRARVSEFRAAYARLDAALKKVTIDDGRVYSCYATPSKTLIKQFGLKDLGNISATAKECTLLENSFSKALGSIKSCASEPQTNGCLPNNYPEDYGYFEKNGTNSRAYVMDNGMILLVSNRGVHLFAVDINGRTAPNKWGQDIFPFVIRVVETKTIGNKVIPVAVDILPPVVDGNGQPPVSASGKTTAEMMKAAAGVKLLD